MIEDRNMFVGVALDSWRLRDVGRDWQDVLARAAAADPAARFERVRDMVGWRWPRRRLIALVAVGLAIAAPAIAAVSGSVSWPWARQPGAQLVASVPSLPGTSMRLRSHGGLITRTSRGIRFASRKATRQRRRFAWQLATKTRISSAAIVVPGSPSVELCSPCTDGESGAFTLAGTRALDLLNGRAELRVRSGDHTTSSPIRLNRLR